MMETYFHTNIHYIALKTGEPRNKETDPSKATGLFIRHWLFNRDLPWENPV